MNSRRFQQSVKSKSARSVNQANINATILSEEVVRFPIAVSEQNSLVIRLDELRSHTQRLAALYQRKLEALDELKKSLLHEAFTGKL